MIPSQVSEINKTFELRGTALSHTTVAVQSNKGVFSDTIEDKDISSPNTDIIYKFVESPIGRGYKRLATIDSTSSYFAIKPQDFHE